MSKYYSIHEFSKIIGVSAQTLRNWDANGKLHPHHTTVSADGLCRNDIPDVLMRKTRCTPL